MRFRATNNDSEERNYVSEKGRKLYPSIFSVLKLHCLAHEVRVQTEGKRVILLATTLCVLYSLKANISFPREKLERDNLISYRTIYLTYQHILQTTCKLDVPNLKSSRTNNNRRSLKMAEGLVLHSFL